MSYATDALKSALLFDKDAETLHLSNKIENLQEIRQGLLAAFGKDDVLVRRVQELTEPPAGIKKQEEVGLLRFHGVASIYNYHNRDIYLEFSLRNGVLLSMLLLIPLPKDWNLTTAFKQLDKANLPCDGQLKDPTIVISYGLPVVNGTRTFQEYDKSEITTIDLHNYPLQDGFQIIAANLRNGEKALNDTLREKAILAGIPEDMLPPRNTAPERVEIRANVEAGWLAFEKWWESAPPDGLNEEGVHATGLAHYYDLGKNDPSSNHYWLQEVGTLANPIVLETTITQRSGSSSAGNQLYPIRYTSRLVNRTPLGEAARALQTLIGDRSKIFSDLDLSLPDSIKLLAFIFAPGEFIQLSFAAGDFTDANEHLLEIGPVELREVDFTIYCPIGKNTGTTDLELEGWATFFGEQFRVRMKPWTLLEGGLADIDGVDLGKLVKSATSLKLPFGLDSVALAYAWISCHLNEQTKIPNATNLQLRLAGTVELVPDAIQLNAIELGFTHNADGSKEVQINAEFRMGPIVLFAFVRYENDGWSFGGTFRADGQGISLTELVDHLVHGFGTAVPTEIPDMFLESIGLEYHTGTRTLRILATTNWVIPDGIPVLGNSESRVNMHLTLARAPQQGGNQTTLSIDWSLAKNEHELTANAFFSRESQTFSFDFQVPDLTKPIVLTQLAEEIGLPDIPRPAAGMLDAVFQVSRLSLDYARPENQMSLAWSRPLASGLLLAEYYQSGTGQQRGQQPTTSNRSRQIKVSWLGNDADATLGIKDLFTLVDLDETVGELLPDFAVDLFTFRQLGFQWSTEGPQNAITFSALSTYRDGTNAFVTIRRGEDQGVVAGLAFGRDPSAPQLSITEQLDFLPKIELLNELLNTVDAVLDHVELTHVLISTVRSRKYHPPALSSGAMQPSVSQPAEQVITRPYGNDYTSLNQGVSVGFKVHFGHHPVLSKIIDLDELHAQVSIGAGNLAFHINIPGAVHLEAGSGNSLTLDRPVVKIEQGLAGPSFGLRGELDLRLYGQSIELGGWMDVSPTGIHAHLQVDDLYIPPSTLLPGVQIKATEEKPLSLLLGVAFQPPGIDLGMQAGFEICSADPDNPYQGEAGFVLEVLEGAVHPKYIEFQIDELDLIGLMEAHTGALYGMRLAQEGADAVGSLGGPADDMANAAGAGLDALEGVLDHIDAIISEVNLQEVRLHWADSIVHLPDGGMVMPGVGFQGGLDFFGWNAYAKLNLSSGGVPGITGYFETEPINIGGILRIWGDGEGIRQVPKISQEINTSQETLKNGPWFLEPGGPVLQFTTRSSPFLHADLHAELFGFLQADIHADVTMEGFSFDFHMGGGDSVFADLECHWWKKDGRFEAHGSMGVHLHGELEPIPGIVLDLDTDLGAEIAILVDSEGFECVVNGIFRYQGVELDMPELMISVAFSSLEELASVIWEHLKDLALDIFEEFLLPIGELIADVAEAVLEVGEEAVAFAADAAVAAAAEAEAVVSDAVAAVGDGIAAVGDETEKLANAAADIGENAAAMALEAAAPVLDKAEELGGMALDIGNAAGKEIAALAGEVGEIIEDVGRFIADLAGEVSDFVKERWEAARRWVAGRLKEALALANKLKDEMLNELTHIADLITDLDKELEELGKKLLSLLEDVEDLAEDVWDTATDWF